jgi:hypothetical protein
LKSNAARTVTTGPHFMKAVPPAPTETGTGFGTVRRKCREASRQARLCGTHPGKHDRGEKPKGIGAYKTRTHRRGLALRAVLTGARARRDMFVCAAPPPERRPEHRTDQADPGPPANGGKARRTCVPANGLTRCMQVRFARARAKCAHRRAFKVHARCFHTHTTHTDNGDTNDEGRHEYG